MNKDLEIFPELPEGGIELDMLGRAKYHYRDRLTLEEIYDKNRHYYFCQYCGGYIQGKTHAKRVNTIGPLAGKCGTDYCCVRCGRTLSFSGRMS
jgi:DNA-directed RNA polymerase subunit RPC12/RpoP